MGKEERNEPEPKALTGDGYISPPHPATEERGYVAPPPPRAGVEAETTKGDDDNDE